MDFLQGLVFLLVSWVPGWLGSLFIALCLVMLYQTALKAWENGGSPK